MKAEFSRTLSDGRAGFPRLLEQIEGWLESQDVPPGPSAQLMIAFDEVISNILDHGSDSGFPLVEVALRRDGDMLHAEIADDGAPFDPLAAPPPDTGLSVEDRPVGGLGIHLVRQLTSDLAYRREGERNRLRFSKDCSLG